MSVALSLCLLLTLLTAKDASFVAGPASNRFQTSRTSDPFVSVSGLQVPVLPRHSVAFAVLTQQSHFGSRLARLAATWGSLASIRVVASDNVTAPWLEAYPAIVPLSQFRGRKSLGQKAMKLWSLLCEDSSFTGREAEARTDLERLNVSHPANTDEHGNVRRANWFVMVDDDTFVVVPNLFAFLAELDPGKHFAGGYVLSHLPGNATMIGGGGGIVLSRKTMTALCAATASEESTCSVSGVRVPAGDAATADCLDELGVKPTHVEGMMPFNVFDHTQRGYCARAWWYPTHMRCEPPRRLISFHYVRGRDYAAAHYFAHTFARVNTVPGPPPATATRFQGPSKVQLMQLAKLRRLAKLRKSGASTPTEPDVAAGYEDGSGDASDSG